jgi:hypothetical protein
MYQNHLSDSHINYPLRRLCAGYTNYLVLRLVCTVRTYDTYYEYFYQTTVAEPSSNFLMYFLYVAELAGAVTRARSSIVMKQLLTSSTDSLFSMINRNTGLRVLEAGFFLGILAESIFALLNSLILIRRMSSAKGGILLL